MVIEVNGLTKHYRVHERPPGVASALRSLWRREYRTIPAVQDVSFSIAAGERVGFLGANGAGKTSTLKMLSGLLYPSAGHARVCGHEPFKRSVGFLRSIMFVAGQKQQLLWDLPASDTFELNRAIYGVPWPVYRRTLDELVALLKLERLLGTPVRQMSLGERMKCELAAALLHQPKVLFLDEPTIGLDVTMQVSVRDFIRRYNEQHGATVVLTSHYMQDVAALCPRIIVISAGRIEWDGPLSELVHRVSPEKRVTLVLAREVAREQLERDSVRIVSFSGVEARLSVHQRDVGAVLAAYLQSLPVADLTVEDPPLEQVLADVFERAPA